jgi:xylan 1,4-beta-xylosidase
MIPALRVLTLVVAFFSHLTSNAQLVMPGDYPDPSVVKIGDFYWASATTSNWGPVFPLLSSSDLVHWKLRSVVFEQPPTWADYYFWAPEITYDRGKVFVYYSAHKKGGNLCLSVATADKPEGPYRDLGPVVCQEAGSIDAFPMRDDKGKLYLVWKEDGNSVEQPTPIWLSEMKEDRTGLIGEKKELFRNDKPWEANLVEGVSMIRNGGYIYAFYAAAGCCGPGCTYATGVARSRSLEGPWEKYDKNPILVADEKWICPGHGTPIEKDGRFYFLYHAYSKESGVYAGRQGMLREFTFTDDGWVEFEESQSYANVYAKSEFRDNFKDRQPNLSWQWPVLNKPKYETNGGSLVIHALGRDTVAFLGQKTLDADYSAHTVLSVAKTQGESGLGVYGDEDNLVAVSLVENAIKIWKKQGGKESLLQEQPVNVGRTVCLQLIATEGYKLTFAYSEDGKKWKNLNSAPVDGSFLPPWDRAVRVGIFSKGVKGQKAVFENFILYH